MIRDRSNLIVEQNIEESSSGSINSRSSPSGGGSCMNVIQNSSRRNLGLLMPDDDIKSSKRIKRLTLN